MDKVIPNSNTLQSLFLPTGMGCKLEWCLQELLGVYRSKSEESALGLQHSWGCSLQAQLPNARWMAEGTSEGLSGKEVQSFVVVN